MTQRHIGLTLALLATIWVTFVADRLLPLEQLGLRPRTLDGLFGIVAMPFLHANLPHLMSNTLPLLVLLFMVILTTRAPVVVTVAISLVSGVLIWLFARNGNHIGASALVFGLATYLIAGGYRAHSALAFGAAVVTFFVYGATLLSGVLPQGSQVSWDGHLAGAVAGVMVARMARNLATTRGAA
jgi:membrane associated rhomboid family serine protease